MCVFSLVYHFTCQRISSQQNAANHQVLRTIKAHVFHVSPVWMTIMLYQSAVRRASRHFYERFEAEYSGLKRRIFQSIMWLECFLYYPLWESLPPLSWLGLCCLASVWAPLNGHPSLRNILYCQCAFAFVSGCAINGLWLFSQFVFPFQSKVLWVYCPHVHQPTSCCCYLIHSLLGGGTSNTNPFLLAYVQELYSSIPISGDSLRHLGLKSVIWMRARVPFLIVKKAFGEVRLCYKELRLGQRFCACVRVYP